MVTERRAPTTAKVAAMIQAHEDIPDAHHAPGGGGADVKSGRLSLPHAVWTVVTFNTPFSGTPEVVPSIEDDSTNEVKMLKTRNVSTTGFEIIDKLKTAATVTVHWIATDAGDP